MPSLVLLVFYPYMCNGIHILTMSVLHRKLQAMDDDYSTINITMVVAQLL